MGNHQRGGTDIEGVGGTWAHSGVGAGPRREGGGGDPPAYPLLSKSTPEEG